jgi:hypothetical protein
VRHHSEVMTETVRHLDTSWKRLQYRGVIRWLQTCINAACAVW